MIGIVGLICAAAVAASARPDQSYKVTILNSGAVNAFALPTGQLYVTRGLIALANDTSELSSVLSHEMAHVLAKHAAIREDEPADNPFGDELPIVRTGPERLEQDLESLAGDRERVRALGGASREFVLSRHDPTAVARQVLAHVPAATGVSDARSELPAAVSRQ